MTIRTKLALWYAGLLILIITVFSLTVYGITRFSMLNVVDEQLEATATEVIRSIGVIPVGEFGALETRFYFRSEEIFNVPGISVQVWQTHTGDIDIEPILARYSPDIMGLDQPLDPGMAHVQQQGFSHVTINDIAGRVTTRPFSSGGQQVGFVQVATPIQTIHESLRVLQIIMVAACVIAVFVAIGLGLWLARRVLHPIEDITRAAARIAETSDLSTRLSWEGPMDELGRQTQVFNRMMERLEYLFKVQQRFVGDVSHELRTPLTAIQGNLEIIQRYGVDPGALEAIHAETGRMARMVNDLLLLARADYGELKIDLFPIDVDRVVLSVFEQAQILVKNRKLKIVLARIESARIQGNADRIVQLLLNLISNAIKFTPEGGTITLALYPQGANAVLEIRDTGIGIEKEDLPRIFDRFYQADNSRYHHSDNDGSGLGLSIAKWIVESHHGTINAESEPSKGTCFIINIPLIPLTQQHNTDPIHHTVNRLSWFLPGRTETGLSETEK